MILGCSSNETFFNDLFLARCLLLLSEERRLLKMDWVGDNSQVFSVKLDQGDTGDCVRRCWCLSGVGKAAGELCLFISQITGLLSSQISSGDAPLGWGLLHPLLRISSHDFTTQGCT